MAEQIVRPAAPASGRLTPASFPFYTAGEDNLRLISYNAAAGVHLKINARMLDVDRTAKPQSWDQTPNTDRSAKSSDFTLSGTTLLNMTVFASAGAPILGQTFVIVQLVRGAGGAALVLGTILQGYVTATQSLGWPGSPLQSSLESGGYFRTVSGTVPAAGQEVFQSVPTGARWQVLAAEIWLNTSAVVVNRYFRLTFYPVGNEVASTMHAGALVAGTAYQFFPSLGQQFQSVANGATTYSFMPMPDLMVMYAGGLIRTFTEHMDPADFYQVVQFNVREWLEP